MIFYLSPLAPVFSLQYDYFIANQLVISSSSISTIIFKFLDFTLTCLILSQFKIQTPISRRILKEAEFYQKLIESERVFYRVSYGLKWLNKMFVLTGDNKSYKITLVSHGIVSFWKALTKQGWQLLSPENSGRLRGGRRAEWRCRVVHSVALGAVKVTHDPAGTGIHRW